MRIERVRLQGIGGFAGEADFSFESGLTVVLGPNGSGKTAVVWGMARTLLLDEIPEGEGSFLAEEGPAWCEVALRVEEESILLRRDFRAGTASWRTAGEEESELLWEGDLESPAEIAMYWDALQSRLGVTHLETWLRSVLLAVPVNAPPVVPEGRGAADNGPLDEGERLLACLEEELRELAGGVDASARKPARGALYEATRSLDRTRRMVQDWEERTRRLQEALGRLDSLAAELEEARGAAETRREVLDQLVSFQALAKERATLDREIDEIRRERDEVRGHVEAVEAAESKLEEEYGDFLNMGTDLETALQEWTEATGSLHDIQRRLHVARQGLASLPVTHSRRNGALAAAVFGILGWLGCLGAGSAGAAVVLAPALAAIAFGAVWLKDRSVEQMRVARREEIIALDVEREEVEASLNASREEMGSLAHLGHPMAIRRAVIQYWKAREEVEKLRAERDRHRPLVETMERFDGALARRKEVDAEARGLISRARYLAGLESKPASLAGEVDMARSQYQASRARAERLQKEYDETRHELSLFEAETPTLGRLERDLVRFTRERNRLERRIRALEIAVEVLRDAVVASRERRRERLSRESNRILSDITGGALTEIRFENGGDPMVREPSGAWRDRAALSRGTREQLDLAVRLATTRQGRRTLPLPLILDNVFMSWDEDRIRSAHEVVRGFTEEGGQVILLSHDARFGEWSPRVIRLDGHGNGFGGHPPAIAA